MERWRSQPEGLSQAEREAVELLEAVSPLQVPEEQRARIAAKVRARTARRSRSVRRKWSRTVVLMLGLGAAASAAVGSYWMAQHGAQSSPPTSAVTGRPRQAVERPLQPEPPPAELAAVEELEPASVAVPPLSTSTPEQLPPSTQLLGAPALERGTSQVPPPAQGGAQQTRQKQVRTEAPFSDKAASRAPRQKQMTSDARLAGQGASPEQRNRQVTSNAPPSEQGTSPEPRQQQVASNAPPSEQGTSPEPHERLVTSNAPPSEQGTSPEPRQKKAQDNSSALEATPPSQDALVYEAMEALRRQGDPARATMLLSEYLNRWPRAALAEEAWALQVEAAVQTNPNTAEELARQYRSWFPHGRYAERVRSLLDGRSEKKGEP